MSTEDKLKLLDQLVYIINSDEDDCYKLELMEMALDNNDLLIKGLIR